MDRLVKMMDITLTAVYIKVYTIYDREVNKMEVAKVFPNGGSQAVRLPKDCRFADDEVLVNRIGNIVILMPKDDPWRGMMEGMRLFTGDFLQDGIEDLPVQEREYL